MLHLKAQIKPLYALNEERKKKQYTVWWSKGVSCTWMDEVVKDIIHCISTCWLALLGHMGFCAIFCLIEMSWGQLVGPYQLLTRIFTLPGTLVVKGRTNNCNLCTSDLGNIGSDPKKNSNVEFGVAQRRPMYMAGWGSWGNHTVSKYTLGEGRHAKYHDHRDQRSCKIVRGWVSF